MKNIKSIIIVLLIALFLFPPHVLAKTSVSAELSQPAAEVQITDGRAVFSLDDLRAGDRNMIGPFDSAAYFFSLPPNWKLSTGGAFELRYDVLIQGFDLDRVGADRIIGANLTVQLNDVVIANIATRGTGSYVEQISIPMEALISPRADGRHRLVITLDAQLSCQYELNAYATIHSSSFFDLSFEEESPQLDFARFPAPFYLVNSIAPDGVIMVMPDNPDPIELQAVMNVAAGFGAVIDGDYNFQFVNYGNLTDAQRAQNHLIFVGLLRHFADLGGVEFRIPVRNGQFQNLPSESVGDGILQMALSPWNPMKAVMLVSGDSLEALSKAAFAVSTGNVLSYQEPALASVSNVRTLPSDIPVLTQYALEDLGYLTETLRGFGTSYAFYRFYVSKAQVATRDGHIDLVYYHSGLLDYGSRSSFSVSLNGQVILTEVFSEESEQVTTLRIRIPSGILRFGENVLEIAPTMLVLPSCDQPALTDTWFTISNRTALSLPVAEADGLSGTLLHDLKFFPSLFTTNSDLSNVAFVLPENDPTAWSVAARISYFFGQATQLGFSNLKVFYGNELPDEARNNHSLVVVGLASEIPFVSEINAQLPAPFDFTTNTASERQLQIAYRIPPGQDVGYLQLLHSANSPENSLLIVSGNTRDGVRLAGNLLVEREFQDRLAGVFAVTNGSQISTGSANTMFSIVGDLFPGAEQDVRNPVPTQMPPLLLEPPEWLQPLMVVSLIVVVGIVLYVVLSMIRKERLRRLREAETAQPVEAASED